VLLKVPPTVCSCLGVLYSVWCDNKDFICTALCRNFKDVELLYLGNWRESGLVAKWSGCLLSFDFLLQTSAGLWDDLGRLFTKLAQWSLTLVLTHSLS
jgi:hypothetical protein